MSVTATRPVVERIAAEIAKRLELLTSGFSSHFRASEIVRPKRYAEYTPENNQIIVQYAEDEVIEAMSRPGNPPAIARNQTYSIHCHIIPSTKDPTPADEYISIVGSEVVRAICRPQATWYTFGSLAIDATWGSFEAIDSARVGGVNVPLTVLYRTDENNPYLARA